MLVPLLPCEGAFPITRQLGTDEMASDQEIAQEIARAVRLAESESKRRSWRKVTTLLAAFGLYNLTDAAAAASAERWTRRAWWWNRRWRWFSALAACDCRHVTPSRTTSPTQRERFPMACPCGVGEQESPSLRPRPMLQPQRRFSWTLWSGTLMATGSATLCFSCSQTFHRRHSMICCRRMSRRRSSERMRLGDLA